MFARSPSWQTPYEHLMVMEISGTLIHVLKENR
jgi:hypothetical protein